MLDASWSELLWLLLAVIAAGVVTGLLAGMFGIGGGAEALLRTSFPAGEDREAVRKMLRNAVEGDQMGINLRTRGDSVRFDYPAAILVSVKP
jgi:hypothetical protein